MTAPRHDVSERILVAAPTGRDAPLAARVLQRAGHECRICGDALELAREAELGAAALLVAEEVLTPAGARAVAAMLERQEPWSDLPVLVFTGAVAKIRARAPSLETLAPLGNVTLLERPIQVVTLLSAVAAAVRARRRQYEARRVLAALAEAVRQRDHFLAVLGHELRNPLSVVMLAIEAIAADPSNPRYVDRIRRQTRQLAHLVEDLLDVSRVTAGKIVLRPARVALVDLVRHALEPVQAAAGGEGLRVELELAEPVTILGDPTRLEQIVGNLLANAVKYTPAGGRVTSRSCRPRARSTARAAASASASRWCAASSSCTAGRSRRRAPAPASAAPSSCGCRSRLSRRRPTSRDPAPTPPRRDARMRRWPRTRRGGSPLRAAASARSATSGSWRTSTPGRRRSPSGCSSSPAARTAWARSTTARR
jgi:signal transduction histidine kinase